MKIILKFTSILIILYLFLFTIPLEISLAEEGIGPPSAQDAVRQGLEYIGQQSGFNTQVTLIQIIGGVIRTILGLVGILALIVIIVSGVQWTTAGGNEEKVMSARKTLINAVIGLLVIVTSYAIVSFVMGKLIPLGT